MMPPAETVVLPDWPGDVIVKLLGEALKLKSDVAVIVTVAGDEVEFP